MVRWQALLIVLVLMGGATAASAQDIGAGPGTLEIGFIPGGGTFYVGGDGNTEVDFNTYDLGASLSWYLTRLFGVEGEAAFGLGIAQDVTAKNKFYEHIHVPHTFNLSGNAMVYPAGADRLFPPYVTAGVGMLTLRTRGAATTTLGLTDTERFVATNFGGGVKLLRGGTGLGTWGIRFDYRVFLIGSDEDADPFFANQENRTGHRIYLGFNWIAKR
jgi:hypothetical protein